MLLVVLGMFGFGFAMVPLYNVFCDITGLNGKTRELAEAEAVQRFEPDEDRWVTVEFLASNNQQMPWEVAPALKRMRVNPGKIYETSYVAHNATGRDMVGQAVPSIAPSKSARFFSKTECFCFTQQPLKAGETRDMPLRFVIDPALPEDVNTLSLAYTFFDVTEQAVN
jgi:cytochrome c oxidase assembly protein subunit 11